jgi:hypothetical protein
MWYTASPEAADAIDVEADRYFFRATTAVRDLTSHSTYYQALSVSAQVSAYIDLARYLKQCASEMRRELKNG